MKHLGDITKIDGGTAPVVEVVIGGSPCQDLSVAGRREGLSGARSGLFMEQIRIIREMRENDRASGRTDEHIRPRFMVWENVPGAFSSNKGEDFRVVLEETAKVSDSSTVIPRPPKEKWTNAGCIMGDGWSIAWRVLDAQFWGVPQRRRRIALVADFGGNTAPEILFERKSVSGDFEESGEEGQGTAQTAERCADTAGNELICLNDQGGGIMSTTTTVSGTLRAQEHGHQPCICYGISAFESNAMKSGNPHSGIYEAETARTLDNNGGSPACNQGGMAIVQGFRHRNGAKSGGLGICTEQALTLGCDGNAAVFDARGNGDGNLAPTITGDHQNRITDYTAIVASPNIVGTLMSRDYKEPGRTDSIDRLVTQNAIVRRLTPLECTRLQGFPDGWVDIGNWTDSKGKKHKDADSPKYKALGNSIAIPPWTYVLSRLNRFCAEHTMASLFDGIGGFSLIWETLNGRGSCIWASEIEEFPMAVTKLRFGNES